MFGFGARKEKPPMIDRARSLRSIPVRNEGLEIEKDESGNTVIRVRVERGRGFFARFQPPVMVRTVELDVLGSFVFGQIDGETSVKEIIERFIARYRTNRREAELSTAEFLKSLMQRGVVSMAVK